MLSMTCVRERHYLMLQCIAVINFGQEEESPPLWVKVQGSFTRLHTVMHAQ